MEGVLPAVCVCVGGGGMEHGCLLTSALKLDTGVKKKIKNLQD